MFFRLLLPAFAWMGLMFSFFFRHYGFEQKWNWGGFTNDTVIQSILFLGNTHIWMVIFKKQLKFKYLRENATKIVILLGVLMVISIELIRYAYSFSNYFNFWNFIFDFLGIILGIGMFRLLYRRCC